MAHRLPLFQTMKYTTGPGEDQPGRKRERERDYRLQMNLWC